MSDEDVKELRSLAADLKKVGGISADDLEKLHEAFDDFNSEEAKDSGKTLRELAGLKEEDSSEGDIRAQLRDMGIPQKVKLAMFGNATCRMLLIGDANRLVQEAVLKNPQIQDREIYDFAKNSNIPENVLRRISDSKSWMKNYLAKLHLVLNPKTPSDVSLKWLRFLRSSDLKKIGSSKNVSQVVATAAKKRIADMQKRK